MRQTLSLFCFLGTMAAACASAPDLPPSKEAGPPTDSTTSTKAIAAGTLDRLDRAYGFRDIVFESSYTDDLGMKLTEDSGDIKYYVRRSDELVLGAAKLSAIEYAYYKGHSWLVMIHAEFGNCAKLLRVIEEENGPGLTTPGEFPDDRSWLGKRVSMSYMPKDDRPACTVIIQSRPLNDKKFAEETLAEMNRLAHRQK